MPLSSGCLRLRAESDPAASSSNSLSKITRTNKKLEKDNVTLTSLNAILKEQVKELSEREKLLARRVNRLKFLNARQQEQIQVLAGAPSQRDAFRAKGEQLTMEVARLNKRIAELTEKISVLQAQLPPTNTRTPATNPATGS